MSVTRLKGRKYWRIEFMLNGRRIRKNTKFTLKQDAENLQAVIRAEVLKSINGIFSPPPPLPVGDFLVKEFLPYLEVKNKLKKNTLEYYRYGIKRLAASDLAKMNMGDLTGQHLMAYQATHSKNSPSTINRDLKTLRYAINTAHEWKKIISVPKVEMVKDENERERVFTDAEKEAYIAGCPEKWRDCAIVLLGTGCRPDEVYGMMWPQVDFDLQLIHIPHGKVERAKRDLLMIPEVYRTLKSRFELRNPNNPWVFPSESKCGHINESSTKKWHNKALVAAKFLDRPPIYTMRHTFGTNMSTKTDSYTLAKIMGHTVSMTQRYVHPISESVTKAFDKLAGETKPSQAEFAKLMDELRTSTDEKRAGEIRELLMKFITPVLPPFDWGAK